MKIGPSRGHFPISPILGRSYNGLRALLRLLCNPSRAYDPTPCGR